MAHLGVRLLIQTALEAEVTEFLGRDRYVRGERARPATHVQLCWLALLLIRVIEDATSGTWRNVRHELDRMHLVTMETAEGRVAQRTTTTSGQAEIFAALEIA
jgi:hypothetical protein